MENHKIVKDTDKSSVRQVNETTIQDSCALAVDKYIIYFHYNDYSTRLLFDAFLIKDIVDIIFDYFISPFIVNISTSVGYYKKKYKNITITIDDIKYKTFNFSFGNLYKDDITPDSIFPDFVFDAVDHRGVKVKKINDLPYINYKSVFEEYIQHLGNINNDKVNSYLSQFNRENHICNNHNITVNNMCTNILFSCQYDVKTNRFRLYHKFCSDVHYRCFGYLTVKDHELLKCIIEIFHILGEYKIFDDVI